MASELLYLAHCLVLEAPMSARDLARSVGKPYSTLLREVNPHDAGAKLGAETLLELMRATGDTMPLAYMAKELGYSLVPLTGQAGAFQTATTEKRAH